MKPLSETLSDNSKAMDDLSKISLNHCTDCRKAKLTSGIEPVLVCTPTLGASLQFAKYVCVNFKRIK